MNDPNSEQEKYFKRANQEAEQRAKGARFIFGWFCLLPLALLGLWVGFTLLALIWASIFG